MLTLWDVVEEHHAEAAYGLARYRRALDSFVSTLADVARDPEHRLLAHMDALTVAEPEIDEAVLVPALRAVDAEALSLAQVAAWATVERGQFSALLPALAHDSSAVRVAIAEVTVRSASQALNIWVQQRLADEPDHPAVRGLLEMVVARRLHPPSLMAWLQSKELAVLKVAARAVRLGAPATYLPIVEHLLEHQEEEVRDAAMIAGLAWGSKFAWQHCQQWALHPVSPSDVAMSLYAALGGHADHLHLCERLHERRWRSQILRALGLSGNANLLGVLLEAMSGPHEARVAVQSLAQIFGFLPWEEPFVVPPMAYDAEEGLPPLERDDLDADLVPKPEDELPEPNVASIRMFCEERAANMSAAKRVVFGAEYAPAKLARAMRTTPLAWHQAWSLIAFIHSGGGFWFNTGAGTSAQLDQLNTLSKLAFQRQARL